MNIFIILLTHTHTKKHQQIHSKWFTTLHFKNPLCVGFFLLRPSSFTILATVSKTSPYPGLLRSFCWTDFFHEEPSVVRWYHFLTSISTTFQDGSFLESRKRGKHQEHVGCSHLTRSFFPWKGCWNERMQYIDSIHIWGWVKKKTAARTLPTKNLQLVCNPLTQCKLCNHPIDAYLELRIDHGTLGWEIPL